MNLYLNHTDFAKLFLLACLSIATSFVIEKFIDPDSGLITILTFWFLLILVTILDAKRKLHKKIEDEEQNKFKQLESLLFILRSFDDKNEPLPLTRGWAASPDLLRYTIKQIHERKPSIVIEAGSGTSTVFMAKALKNTSGGKVYALEHDKRFAKKSSSLIERHDLSDNAEVIYAPLRDFGINGEKWKWYDFTNLSLDEKIDMLFIDGPRGKLQRLSRYPALPLMEEKIKDSTLVLLDDGDRGDEKRIVEKWKDNYDCEVKYLDLEKGAYDIRLD